MADLSAVWGSWLVYCVAAIFIALVIQFTIYIIARSFNLAELERNTKSEILQVAATFFLAVFLVLIVGSLSDYINSQMYGTISCGGRSVTITGIDSALAVMQCKVIEKAVALESLHNSIRGEANSAYFLFYSHFSLVGIPVFSGQYISSLYQTIEAFRYKNALTTTMLIALNALITFIALIKMSMLTLFLPFGLLLRSFYFTRGIGSLFISIAFGFYFIFPYLFIITDPGFVKLQPPAAPAMPTGSNFCLPTFSSVVSMVNFAAGSAAFASPSDSAISTDLARIYASLIIHPLAAFFMTLIAVRYLIYLFGEESYDLLRMTARLI